MSTKLIFMSYDIYGFRLHVLSNVWIVGTSLLIDRVLANTLLFPRSYNSNNGVKFCVEEGRVRLVITGGWILCRLRNIFKWLCNTLLYINWRLISLIRKKKQIYIYPAKKTFSMQMTYYLELTFCRVNDLRIKMASWWHLPCVTTLQLLHTDQWSPPAQTRCKEKEEKTLLWPWF